MLSTAILFGLMATASAFCGAPPASESFKAVHAMYANVSISTGITPRASKPFVAFKPTVTINTYVHVIYSGSNPKTATGNIPDTKIRAQVKINLSQKTFILSVIMEANICRLLSLIRLSEIVASNSSLLEQRATTIKRHKRG
jgi:hypothetical protein